MAGSFLVRAAVADDYEPVCALFAEVDELHVLDNIAVSSLARREGVGSALTHTAEHWARSHGANWLELGVYEFNAGARAFYRALGYDPVLTKLRKPLLGGDG